MSGLVALESGMKTEESGVWGGGGGGGRYYEEEKMEVSWRRRATDGDLGTVWPWKIFSFFRKFSLYLKISI